MATQITFGGHSRAAILRGVNKLDRGYLSRYFVTNAETMGAELENPVILLSEKKISSMRDLLPILEEPRSQRKRNVEPAKLQLILGIDTSQLLNTLRLYATGNRLAGGRHAIETYSLDAMGQSEKLQSPNT